VIDFGNGPYDAIVVHFWSSMGFDVNGQSISLLPPSLPPLTPLPP